MFLLGGPAFSGKTLLAHLLNQGHVVCLDEPDFHDPAQRHRAMPLLRSLFPDRALPESPERALTVPEAVTFLERCERALHPYTLGMKTAGVVFLEYAREYRARGSPTIAVVRDIRDTLAEAPLPSWIAGERGLNGMYRQVWKEHDLVDLWIRYEEFVTRPEAVIDRIARLLGTELSVRDSWMPEEIHRTMVKLERHEMLRNGRITSSQVGLWRSAGRTFSRQTHATAKMMGYPAK